MGDMPKRWAGVVIAILTGLLAGAGGAALGWAAGTRLARGFVFDWYVHAAASAFPPSEVLFASAGVAAVVAFLASGLLVWPTAALTRAWSQRLRYTPPRYTEPVGLDVHTGRLALFLPLVLGALVALVGYVTLQAPTFQGAPPIRTLSAEGYVLLAAGAGGAAGLAAGFLASWTTFHGVVSGRIVRDAGKNLIARVSLFGMRNAKASVALIIGVTLVAGAYASTITTNVDVADVMPRGDPNTDAAHNLTQKFKSSFTQQVTFQFHVLDMRNASQAQLYARESAAKLPDRATDEKPHNITDELYVRAMAEAIAFVLDHPKHTVFTGSVGSPDFYKLINWTIAGGTTRQNTNGNASYKLPDTSPQGSLQYRSVDEGVTRAIYPVIDAVTSPNWTQTAVLVLVDPKSEASSKEIGEAALAVKEDWLKAVREGKTQYTVFGPDNPPLFSVDLPLANAHASALTKHDFTLLLPIIGVFIAITLFIAFRSFLSVFVTFTMLSIAVLWTFGVMGALRIPLNTINLATVPLIMGVGIDYGIHMMNEYQEQRAHGRTAAEAWTAAAGGSALALFVGMLTTAAGLVVMIVSPSLLVAQLGLLANIALISCYILAVLYIPAVTTIAETFRGSRGAPKRVEFHPSRLMPTFATGISRARWAVLLVLLLVAVASATAASGIRREPFGDPPRNWLDDDPLRREHEEAIKGFYEKEDDAVKANVLIFEGDVTDPAVHAYISGITSTLRANAMNGTWVDGEGKTHESRVIADTLRDLPFLVNTYLTVRGGVPGAAQFLGADALQQRLAPMDPEAGQRLDSYPTTREEMKALLDECHDSPLYQFQNLFLDHPDYDMTVTIFSVRAASYAHAEEVWKEVHAAIDANAALKPDDLHVSFFGNTAINYLFVAKQVPWLGYMTAVTSTLVILIVFAVTRDLRTTAVVGTMNVLAGLVWLGALTLPFIDIGLAISLTLPLVFIFCMGSDYTLHLAMRCRRTKDTYVAFEGVGKGVLYSFVTTFGAFLIFTRISDLAGRRSMIATTIAIALVFLVTLALVPIFYPVKKDQRREMDRNVPVVEDRRVIPEAARPAAPTPPARKARAGE